MNYIKSFFLILSIFVLLGCQSKQTNSTTINIIHVNDIHSHLDNEPFYLDINETTYKFNAGGYPLLGSTIKQLKSKQKNTLLLNAGDALEGTLYFTLFKGKADADMMNIVNWDAFALGNHEFDEGDERLAEFLKDLNIPIISSNIYAPQNNPLYQHWEDYIIKEFNAQEVGIIGVDTVKETRDSSSPGDNIEFSDAYESVQKQVQALEFQGINKIIVLSHLGYESDLQLAQTVTGIDVIVGGHSHTVLGDLESLGIHSTGEYPTIQNTQEEKIVCIVQAGSFGKMLGNLEVIFDTDGEITSCSGNPIIPVDTSVQYIENNGSHMQLGNSQNSIVQSYIENSPSLFMTEPDTALESKLEEYKKLVSSKELELLGSAQETLYHVRIPGHPYGENSADNNPLGSDVVPVVAKSFYQRVKNSDLVILNAGGVRTEIKKGEINTADVYKLLPFSNTLVTLEMNASQIKQVLEDALEHIGADYSGSGSFPYSYGLRYDVNMSQTFSHRVSNLDILNKETTQYTPIDSSQSYLVTTISYLAGGKDGYTTFKTLESTDSYYDYANSFVVYVEDLEKNNKMVSKVSPQDHCVKSFYP